MHTIKLISIILAAMLTIGLGYTATHSKYNFYYHFQSYCIENLHKGHRLNYRQFVIRNVIMWLLAIAACVAVAFIP